MSIKGISFQPLPVTDQDRALAFYCDVLGFTIEMDAPFETDWRWIFVAIPGSEGRLNFARKDRYSIAEGEPILALVSDDVDADCAAWSAKGARIAMPPADAPWDPASRWALISDSEGNLIFVQSSKG